MRQRPEMPAIISTSAPTEAVLVRHSLRVGNSTLQRLFAYGAPFACVIAICLPISAGQAHTLPKSATLVSLLDGASGLASTLAASSKRRCAAASSEPELANTEGHKQTGTCQHLSKACLHSVSLSVHLSIFLPGKRCDPAHIQKQSSKLTCLTRRSCHRAATVHHGSSGLCHQATKRPASAVSAVVHHQGRRFDKSPLGPVRRRSAGSDGL